MKIYYHVWSIYSINSLLVSAINSDESSPWFSFCKPMNLLMVPVMCAWGTLGCSEQKGVLRNQELHSKWSLREFPWLLVHNAGHGTHVCTSVKTPVVASKGANLVQSWRKRWMKAYVSKPWKTLAFATIQTAIRNDNWSRVERKTMKSSPIIVKDWRFRALSIYLIWVNRRPRKLCPTVAISNCCHPRTPVFIVFHDADSSLERHLKQLRCGCSPGTRQSYTQRLADLAAT